MKKKLLKKKYHEALFPGILSLLIMAEVLFVLMITGYLFAADMDEQVAADAAKTYVFKTWLKGDDIKVRCQDGIVTLTGTVASEPHSILAAETVADLPGVKSVETRLEVRGSIPEKNSDAWIQIRVNNMLGLHRNLDNDHIVVDVKDSLVTLRGKSGSQAGKELASECVKDVAGVKDVDNRMTVAKAARPMQKTVDEIIDDASIKAQIKMALLFLRGTDSFRTHITVDRGAVTVTGMAKNAAEIELVGKRIANIRGVISIDNRMIIE